MLVKSLCRPLSTEVKGKTKGGRRDRRGQDLTTSSFHLLWRTLKRGYICSAIAQGVQCILLTAALLALSQANSLFLMYTYKIMNNAEKGDGGPHAGVLQRRDISSLIWKSTSWWKKKNILIFHWKKRKLYKMLGLKHLINSKMKF